MFRDSRMFRRLVKDFKFQQKNFEILEVGVGVGPDKSSLDKCERLIQGEFFPKWQASQKLAREGLAYHFTRLVRADDVLQFGFIIGTNREVYGFKSVADRAGKFLVDELRIEPHWYQDMYQVVLSMMNTISSTRLMSLDFRTVADCNIRIFRDPGYMAADVLQTLDDLPRVFGDPFGGRGPHDGYKFVWGLTCVQLPALLWQVVKFLWEKEEKRASIEEVLEVAWGGTNANEDSSENKIRSAQNRLRQAFSEKKIPWRLTVKGEFLQLVEEA